MLPHPAESGSIVTMLVATRRRLILLAMASGCGSVSEPGPDAGDELGTLRDGCAVLLRMDEASWGGPGSVQDACGGNHHGTPSGTIATVVDGARGRAGQFKGDGCIEIADAPALRPASELTMSAWVLPTALNDIDEVAVWTRALTDPEIAQWYTSTKPH